MAIVHAAATTLPPIDNQVQGVACEEELGVTPCFIGAHSLLTMRARRRGGDGDEAIARIVVVLALECMEEL